MPANASGNYVDQGNETRFSLVARTTPKAKTLHMAISVTVDWGSSLQYLGELHLYLFCLLHCQAWR